MRAEKGTITFNPDVEVIELFDDGEDEFTFDNVLPDGSPKVSQTQGRQYRAPPGRKYCPPVDTVWAHFKAVRLATDGTMYGLPPPGEINHQGRQPHFFTCPEDEVYDVPFAADISSDVNKQEFVSYNCMAYWTDTAVFFAVHDPKRK